MYIVINLFLAVLCLVAAFKGGAKIRRKYGLRGFLNVITAISGLCALSALAVVFGATHHTLIFASPYWLFAVPLAFGMLFGMADAHDKERALKLKTERPKHTFCPNCKEELKERQFDGEAKLACPACTYVFWDNPKMVTVVLVPSADRTQLLLIKRSIPPRIGMYALPGGYLKGGETLEEGAIRECWEETGLRVTIDRLLWQAPVPKGNELLVFFLANPTEGATSISNETSEVGYFALDKMPENIAFPLHQQAIANWVAQSKPATTAAATAAPTDSTPPTA